MGTVFSLLALRVSSPLNPFAPGNAHSPTGAQGGMMHGSPGGLLLMWTGIFVLILIAVGIYAALRAARDKRDFGTMPETPLELLKKRYARGEISKAQFEEMKRDLSRD